MALLQSGSKLRQGAAAPAFSLKGTDGKMHALSAFSGKPVLIMFICNHCPFVQAKWETMIALAKTYQPKGLVVIGINSNESENYPDDSFENMVKTAREKQLPFLYIHDETQGVAKAYGAVCTPDPFLFDAAHHLVYHGRFDNALNPGEKATTHEMADAIEAVLANRPVKAWFLPSQGCSIKWKG